MIKITLQYLQYVNNLLVVCNCLKENFKEHIRLKIKVGNLC